MSDPLGIRLGNPLNLEANGDSWIGLTPTQNHLPYLTFSAPVYGLRAGMIDTLTKVNHRGLTSLARLIPVYAPKTENDVDSYILDVSRRLGIGPDEPLDLSTEDALIAYAKAIVTHEQGHSPLGDWFPDEIWREAAQMALTHMTEIA